MHIIEFINPTKAPPTVPLKHVGPQAIPAPINIPLNEIHDVFTIHSYDENGNPYSEMHEEIRPGKEGIVNPGANLVPHPIAMAMHPLETGNDFVGSPAIESTNPFVMHTDNEDSSKPTLAEKPADIPETTKDDRYQTHIVELTKNKDPEEHTHSPISPNVGKPIETGDSISPAKAISLENPRPHNEAEADKVLADHKHHKEEAKEKSVEHTHDEHQANEPHTNEAHKPVLHDVHNKKLEESTDDKVTTVEGTKEENTALIHTTKNEKVNEKPVERSGVIPKNEEQNSEDTRDSPKKKGNATLVPEDHTVSKVEEIGKMLQNFDNVTKALSDNIVKNSQELTGSSGTKKDSVSEDTETADGRANVKAIGKLLKNFDNVTKSLSDNIVRNAHRVTGTKKDATFIKEWTQAQKDAYTLWRRKALINFHMRNPDKPIPRNTLSLSKNSLCPKFCRFFCDPWCVKIGCCTLSAEKLNIYKQIEEEQEKLHPGSKPDTRESKFLRKH